MTQPHATQAHRRSTKSQNTTFVPHDLGEPQAQVAWFARVCECVYVCMCSFVLVSCLRARAYACVMILSNGAVLCCVLQPSRSTMACLSASTCVGVYYWSCFKGSVGILRLELFPSWVVIISVDSRVELVERETGQRGVLCGVCWFYGLF